MREVIYSIPVSVGKACYGVNGGNDAVLHCQKDIPAHFCAAAVDKASCHYESCIAHEYFFPYETGRTFDVSDC
jgi:hypothetical protein